MEIIFLIKFFFYSTKSFTFFFFRFLFSLLFLPMLRQAHTKRLQAPFNSTAKPTHRDTTGKKDKE